MKKIKIIWTQSYTDEYDTKLVARGIPEGDFEEISDEDLATLRQNLYRIPRPSYDLEPRIVLLDDAPVPLRLAEIKEVLKKFELELARDKEKRRLAAEKAKLTKAEKERLRFEELKKKYEG